MRHLIGFVVLIYCISMGYSQGVNKEYLLGNVDQQSDARFVQLEDQHTRGAARGQYLRKEAYEAFKKMAETADTEGIQLIIISATRNFSQQKGIWERKWEVESAISDEAQRAKKILLYSSMPGTSRHHWGTDMDLNNLNNEYFESGEGLILYEWLQRNAAKFGFCQPYTSKAFGRTGYEEEKWHWSYLPLSSVFLKHYVDTIQHSDIKGFSGSEIASQIDVIKNYVQGVSCK